MSIKSRIFMPLAIFAALLSLMVVANAQGDFRGYKSVMYSGSASSPSFVGASDAELDIERIDSKGNVVGSLTLSGKTSLVWSVSGKIDSNGVIRLSGQNDFRLDFTGRLSGSEINGDFVITAKNGKRSGKMRLDSNSSIGSSGDSSDSEDDPDGGSMGSGSGSGSESGVPNCPSGVFEGVSTGVFNKKKISVRLEFTKYATVENSEMNLTYSGGIQRSGSVFGDWETSSRMRVTGNIGGLPTSMQLNFSGSRITGKFMVPVNTQPVYGNFTVSCVGGGRSEGGSGSKGGSDDDDSGSAGSSSAPPQGSGSYSTDFDTSAEFAPCESGEYRGNGVSIRVTDYRTIENSEITIDLTNKYGGNGVFNGTWESKPKMLLTGHLGGRPTRINATFAGKKVSGKYSIAHMNGPTVGNFVASCVE